MSDGGDDFENALEHAYEEGKSRKSENAKRKSRFRAIGSKKEDETTSPGPKANSEQTTSEEKPKKIAPETKDDSESDIFSDAGSDYQVDLSGSGSESEEEKPSANEGSKDYFENAIGVERKEKEESEPVDPIMSALEKLKRTTKDSEPDQPGAEYDDGIDEGFSDEDDVPKKKQKK